jgi:hypothetical protein
MISSKISMNVAMDEEEDHCKVVFAGLLPELAWK